MPHPVLHKSPTIQDLQRYVADTLRHRDLDATSLSKNYLLLVEEVGELAKAIRKQEGVKFATDTERKNVEHEIADVLFVLMSVCNILEIDAEQALRDKEELNKLRAWT
jgi:NTP pyrophosphatase (non-canonical NTP hydrolase)